MPWTASLAVGSIAVLHSLFRIGELCPWENPWIMALVLDKWRPTLDLSPDQKHFAATVVHNAGVYDGIVAAGLIATLLVTPRPFYVQVALLAGGVVAGLFGAATLTKPTIVQAGCGALAIAALLWSRF